MEEPKYCFIQFKYSYKTAPLEEIRVVGNIPELGNWDVTKAEKMVTSKIDYPLWKTKENIKVRQNTEIEYKYVIFSESKFLRWESLPNNANRSLKIKNMVRIVIWDSQDSTGSRIEKCTKCNISSGDSVSPILEKGEIENKFDLREHRHKIFSCNDKPALEFSPMVKKEKDSLGEKKQESEEVDEFQDLNFFSDEEAEPLAKDKSITEEKKEAELNDSDQVIMCALYLPYRAYQNPDGVWDLELTKETFPRTLWKIANKENVKWVGMLKNYFQIEKEEDRNRLISVLQKQHNMYTIEISYDIYKKINYFLNGICVPLFHCITLSNDIMSNFLNFEEYWKAFKEYNEMIAKEITNLANEKTLILLHDYYFILVPSLFYSLCSHYNKNILQKIAIGLFIHSSFPCHDIFRRFPYREEMLKSMLNCSMIGFHTFDCSRNFLTSSKRLLLVNFESTIKGDLALSYYGRNLIIRVKNATAEPALIEEEIQTPEFKETYEDIKKRHAGKYIFVSLDNLQFVAGIKLKLEGYRRFLRDIGDNFQQNVFLQYISYSIEETIISDDDVINQTLDKIEILRQIRELGDVIHNEFGPGVLEIIEHEVSYPMRLAIWASAKCFVRTSKRESFSLGIYEFLTLKMLLNDTNEIAYILSESSGVNSSLAGTIRINPYDVNSIRKGFSDAFQVHFDQIATSGTKEKDFIHVRKNRFTDWLYSFLNDMKTIHENQSNTYCIGTGIGINFKLMRTNSLSFKELNRKLLFENYDKAKRRLIFLDYEGTLPAAIYKEDAYQAKGQKPHERVLYLLQQLTEDKRNTVFIITGREAKLVSSWFSSVKDLGLACEHGFMYRYSSNPNALNKWEKMIDDFVNDWRKICIDELVPYTERCEGSLIEIKEASVVWQYRDCDPELSRAFASVIALDLETSMKNLNVNIISGKGYIEAIAKGINKGAFVAFITKEELKKNRAPDFIMAIGDDIADEEMFKYLAKKKSEIKKYAKNLKIHTVTVGKKPSTADSYVDTPQDVTNLIDTFVRLSWKKRSRSFYDIRSISKEASNSEFLIEKSDSDEMSNEV